MQTFKFNTMKSIFTACALLLVIQLQAQKDNTLSEIRKNDYQIELGFSSIRAIYNNTSSATILFKKKYQTGNLVDVNSVKFLRAHISLNSQINFSDDPTRMDGDTTEVGYHPSNVIDITAGIGIEKQFQNRNFVHFVGMDLYGRYFRTDDDFPYNSTFGGIITNSTHTTDRNIRTLDVGVSPFFGVKYYITDQFSVGLESGFRLTYFDTKIQELQMDSEYDPQTGEYNNLFEEFEPVSSKGVRFNFLGIRYITVGYSF